MKFLNLLFLIIFVTTAFAYSFPNGNDSNKKGIIKAVIIDSKTNTPVEYANVTLHNSNDSSFVTGTVTGNNGELLIGNIPDGSYYVKISYIGYQKLFVPNINVTKEKKEIQLGTLKLAAQDVQLDAVSVVGERAAEELRLDKKVINVAQNLSAAGGTALDVLENQPSIQVDQDGNVSLRGSTNFTILVNGRPSVLQGGDALRQIPASMIDNIEIITNPSAKYDAEGAAGIINIVMKKQTEDSMTGIVNAGLGSRTKYNGDFSVNYKSGDYALTGSADYRRNTFHINNFVDRTAVLPDNTSFLNTNLAGKMMRDNFNIKAGVDYNVGDNSLISLSGLYGEFILERDFLFKFSDTGSNNETNYTLSNDGMDINSKFFNAVLYYNSQFTPKVDELSFEATYTNVDLPNVQSTKEYDTDPSFEQLSSEPLWKELKNDSERNEGRIKINYSYTFGPKSKLETGVQTNLFYKNFDIVNQYYDWDTQQWIINPDYTNKFDFRNNVYSAFATYTNELAGFDYQLGLRAEQTDRMLDQKTLSQDFKYNETHLFPSLSVSTKMTEEQQIQFSYSRRINRPNEFSLNPFPVFSTSYVTFIGNPNLLPELTHSLELNYQYFLKGLFFSVQTYYRKTDNSITQTHTLLEDGSIKLSSDNVAKNETFGAEISSSITLIPWLKLDPSVNLFQNNMSGLYEGEQTERELFTWSSRLNATVTLTPSTRFQTMINYIGKQQTLQQVTDPIINLTFSVRQELFNKQLIATVSAQNLFDAGRFNFNSSGSNFNMSGRFRPEAPMFRLTLSYNFNNYKNTSRPTERVDINDGGGM
ncbi:MAG: TonB-dependent receptor [Bacteroidota bacterium]